MRNFILRRWFLARILLIANPVIEEIGARWDGVNGVCPFPLPSHGHNLVNRIIGLKPNDTSLIILFGGHERIDRKQPFLNRQFFKEEFASFLKQELVIGQFGDVTREGFLF